VGRSSLRTVPAEWVQYVVQLLEVRVPVAVAEPACCAWGGGWDGAK
jgi:hypothetical protein